MGPLVCWCVGNRSNSCPYTFPAKGIQLTWTDGRKQGRRGLALGQEGEMEPRSKLQL